MKYTEILEACWKGYQQQGMKKKGARMVPNCVPVSEQEMEEDLKKWFKEKWVRFGPDGKIRGDCARGSESEGKPKCLPQSKAHALGKKGRASAAAKKRREDPNPERRGAAKNVATKVREQGEFSITDAPESNIKILFLKTVNGNEYRLVKQGSVYKIYVNRSRKTKQEFPSFDLAKKALQQLLLKAVHKDEQGVAEGNNDDWDDADEFGMPGSEFFSDDDRLRDGDYVRDRQDGEYGEIFRMSGDPSERRVRILDRDGRGWYISPDRLEPVDRNDPDIMRYFGKKRRQDIDEKQDACYRKVKSRYKVWPSAYASGALVQCRKKGAANWGTGAKKK